MKKLSILLAFFMLVGFVVQAQQKITGTVTQASDGMPIPGVSVYVKSNQTLGTATNIDGQYTLNVPSGAKVLVFTAVGMQTVERVIGDLTTIDVVMEPESLEMDEVVVTANAIEREKRSLGYAVATVGGEDVNKSQESNVVNQLSGKIAGVKVLNSSGNVGSSSRIQIRGTNSFSGSGQPLFVVDGVPISNSNYVGEGNERGSGFDAGNRASDINPDDIKSVSVLKGGAAAALYGARARDGVIVITTKRGSKSQKKHSINYSGSIGFSSPLILPDYQNDYSQGTYGHYRNTSLNGWGGDISKLEGIEFNDINDEPTTLESRPDNIKDFFEVGQTISNSVSIAGGDEKSDYRLGFTNLSQEGIVPTSELKRNTVSFNGGRKFENNFTSRVSVNYYRSQVEGRVESGGNNNNALMGTVLTLPRTFNLDDWKDYKKEDGTQRKLGDFSNNPYWILNENRNQSTLDRIVGNFQLSYNPYEWLDITGRVGTDFYREHRRNVVAKGSVGNTEGLFVEEDIYQREFNSDLMITIDKDINDDINVKFLLGHNVNQRQFQTLGNTAKTLTVGGLYNFGNAAVNTPSNYYSNRRLWGAYGDLSLSYKNWAFLNGTLRNDNSSTLPEENNSYWYYSGNASVILTDAIPSLKSGILSYLKLRANYAQVGSDEDPYQLDFVYTPLSSYFVQFNTDNSYPHGGYLAFGAPRTIPATDLEPQKKNEFEAGLDIYFFNNRFGFEFAYYKSVTTNQIVSIPIPWTTGFTRKRANVGEISNEGIELRMNVIPVSSKDFKWDINVNFGMNSTTVEELADGVEELNILSSFNSLQIKARPGEAYGIFGKQIKRNENGQKIVNETTGLYEFDDTPVRFGDIDPKWTMGINNSFRYKNISMSALVDFRVGGKMYSNTVRSLRSLGLAEETAENREQTVINEGVVEVVDGDGNVTYKENTTPVKSMDEYWDNYYDNTIAETAIFNSDYVKLREVSLGYVLPSKWLDRIPFGRVEISAYGRNLWLIYSEIPHIDPESSQYGSATVGGIEWGGVPSTRNFGINLKLTF